MRTPLRYRPDMSTLSLEWNWKSASDVGKVPASGTPKPTSRSGISIAAARSMHSATGIPKSLRRW